MWEVWNCKDASIELIRWTINGFDLELPLLSNSVYEKVEQQRLRKSKYSKWHYVFSIVLETSCFTLICGDKDPPRFKEENMSINASKIALFKNYRNNIRNINMIRLFSK